MRPKFRVIGLLALLTVSTACAPTADRLKWVGKEPPLAEMKNPVETKEPPYQKISWPTAPRPAQPAVQSANSLWSSDSRTFFRDQRARNIGDILKVQVEISDKAELDNKTERKRDNSSSLGAGSVFGVQDKLVGWLPGKANPASLLSVNGAMDGTGEGVIEREEVIETEIAAVVIDKLQNGNLVIYGSQEVRVNHEVRQLTVEGVIRPEDIRSNNIVSSNQIAEARISYGGRGLISDVQQPRVGNQLIDILSPF